MRLPARVSSARSRRAWRRWVLLLLGVGLLALAPTRVSAQSNDSVIVSWTAPGDDGPVGTATRYDLRFAQSPITVDNFDQATAVTNLPTPRPSGSSQRVVVHLTPGQTYYFAIRTVDNRGNWSELSNVAVWDGSLDSAPPSAPHGVKARRHDDGIHVTWDANTEADLAGYNVYRDVGAGFVRLNNTLLTGTEYVDSQVPSDAQALSYELTAVDVRGNESARTIAPAIGIGAAANEWALKSVYPNPSRLGQAVHLPVVVPVTAHGDALVEILDAGGRIVRRIVLPSPLPGNTEVVWDGNNDAGFATAPGVYRGWLIAGGTRRGVRLLRVP